MSIKSQFVFVKKERKINEGKKEKKKERKCEDKGNIVDRWSRIEISV